jgi:excisionase family DNA binding protein
METNLLPQMNSDEAAQYLGVSPATLATWRCRKNYPLNYVKIGALVRYRRSDLDAFLEARTVVIGNRAASPAL